LCPLSVHLSVPKDWCSWVLSSDPAPVSPDAPRSNAMGTRRRSLDGTWQRIPDRLRIDVNSGKEPVASIAMLASIRPLGGHRS
jgi:hypothetical protein